MTEVALAARDHAFELLGLPELIAIVRPENVRSQAVARKLGMRVERQVHNPVLRPTGRRLGAARAHCRLSGRYSVRRVLYHESMNNYQYRQALRQAQRDIERQVRSAERRIESEMRQQLARDQRAYEQAVRQAERDTLRAIRGY